MNVSHFKSSTETLESQSMPGHGCYKGLFSSLLSEIKSYDGADPLLPWISGIRKMKETLPPQLLKQKLPRFLQRCSETFLTDRHYSNDLRYLRVWLQLMDFVDDPKEILTTMKANHIGLKKSWFYQAYALYYEKQKKFDAADRIYHLGIRNLAERADELQSSYEQFLLRKGRHKNKRVQVRKGNCVISSRESVREYNEKSSTTEVRKKEPSPQRPAEDAVNLLMNMLKEPLEPSVTIRGFTGENLETGFELSRKKLETSMQQVKIDDLHKHWSESFEIYFDAADATYGKAEVLEKAIQAQNSNMVVSTSQAFMCERPHIGPLNCYKDPNVKKVHQAGIREDTVVYKFIGSTISDEPEVENVWHHGLIDPTVNLKEAMEDINNMFGKSIEFTRKSRQKKHDAGCNTRGYSGEFLILPDDESSDGKAEDGIDGMPQEQHCHEIKSRPDKEDGMSSVDDRSNFLVFSCDELDKLEHNSLPNSHAGDKRDLFEQTSFTKEAFSEINKLFAAPVDFQC